MTKMPKNLTFDLYQYEFPSFDSNLLDSQKLQIFSVFNPKKVLNVKANIVEMSNFDSR